MSYICFYNPCNFGDAFFSSPFIRHICESNPSRTFYYFIPKGEYLFSGYPLSNLNNIFTTVLLGNNHLHKEVIQLIRHNITNRYADKTINQSRYIFFNVWCTSFSCGDLDIYGLRTGFTHTVDQINTHYNETFINTEIPNNKLMPIVNIPKTIYSHNGYRNWLMKWRENSGIGDHKRTLVFIFNFVLQSAVTHPYVMNDYIVGLARMFQNTRTFLVPNHAPVFDAFPNIVCCDRLFGYSETEKSFQNLFILETIVRECDIIVSQYCGASWIWFNEHLTRYYDTHNKPIYLTHPVRDNDYATKMNEWIRVSFDRNIENRDIVEFVALSDLPSVIV